MQPSGEGAYTEIGMQIFPIWNIRMLNFLTCAWEFTGKYGHG